MFPPTVAGDRAPNGVMAEISKLYFDISNGTYPAAMDALTDVVPVSQILFGSDYPFVKVATTVEGLKKYSQVLDERHGSHQPRKRAAPVSRIKRITDQCVKVRRLPRCRRQPGALIVGGLIDERARVVGRRR